MSTTIRTQWLEWEAALEAGTHSPVEVFERTHDLLKQLSNEDRASATSLFAQLPARCKGWTHARVICLAVECAQAVVWLWAGRVEDRLAVWRKGDVEVVEFGSPALTGLFRSHYCCQLLAGGNIPDALEVCSKGLKALQFGPHASAEFRLHGAAVEAMDRLGWHERAFEMGMRLEQTLAAKSPDYAHERAMNLGNLAYIIFFMERESCAGQPVSTPMCMRAEAFAHTAIALLRPGADRRFPRLIMTLLHTLAQLHLLTGQVEEALSDYRRIDEELDAHPLLRIEDSLLSSGRALLDLARGDPQRALLVLDGVGHELVPLRADWNTLEWWEVRGKVLAALGRWQEAHEAQVNYMRAWRAMSRQRAQAWAEVVQRRLDFNNASALQFLSHDLRAPLDSMVAVARGSADGGSPETMKRLSTLAERASHIANRSIDYMRALLAEEADFQLLDLTTVLDDACEDTEALGADKFVRLHRDLHGPAWTLGDQDLLRRAFANLLTNAIRHAPADSAVTVTLRAAGGEAWYVTVADLGPGFDPEQLKLLHAQTHPSPSGHGLGLAFVSRALAKHDATLKVANNAPRGALVQVRFHAMVTPYEPPSAAVKAAAGLAAGSS